MVINLIKFKFMNRTIFNYVLVHVARTWERIRVTRPLQEMPLDNIASVEAIEQIATEIYNNDIVQGFLTTVDDDYWYNTTDTMSDIYIEETAANLIEYYL
jgi:hypothetical protein